MSRDLGWVTAEWDPVSRTWSLEDAAPWPAGEKAQAESERDALQKAHGGTWALAMVTLYEGSVVGPERAESLS